MRTGKYKEHEDFQVYKIDVFYNGHLIVSRVFLQSSIQGFSPVLFSKMFSQNLSPVLHLLHVLFSAKESINEVYNPFHLHPFSVFALQFNLTLTYM